MFLNFKQKSTAFFRLTVILHGGLCQTWGLRQPRAGVLYTVGTQHFIYTLEVLYHAENTRKPSFLIIGLRPCGIHLRALMPSRAMLNPILVQAIEPGGVDHHKKKKTPRASKTGPVTGEVQGPDL